MGQPGDPPVIQSQIDTVPLAINSAYKPIIFKVTTNMTRAELQVRGDVYARNDINQAFELLAQKYQKRYLGNNYFIFDISDLIQTRLTFDRETDLPSAGAITDNKNSICEFYVVFRLIYYDDYGVPTAHGTMTSSTYRAVNTILQHEDTLTLVDYTLNDPTA